MRASIVIALFAVLAAPATSRADTVTCGDGTTSESGRGACSHHGGIAKARAPAKHKKTTRKADVPVPREPRHEPTRESRTTTTTTRDRTPTPTKSVNIIVRCADGSISWATGRGACSQHGGVAEERVQRHEQGAPMARCNDNTISYSAQHSGTCSQHGGVREWLDK